MKKLLLAFAVCAFAMMTSCGKSKTELEAESRSAEKTSLEVRKKMEDEEKQFQAKLKTIAAVSEKEANERLNSNTSAKDVDGFSADESLTKKFQEKLLVRLKDPSSVQFRDLKLNYRRDALCGMINSKNSFGGYNGFSGFVVTEKDAYLQTNKKNDIEDLLYIATAQEQGCIE